MATNGNTKLEKQRNLFAGIAAVLLLIVILLLILCLPKCCAKEETPVEPTETTPVTEYVEPTDPPTTEQPTTTAEPTTEPPVTEEPTTTEAPATTTTTTARSTTTTRTTTRATTTTTKAPTTTATTTTTTTPAFTYKVYAVTGAAPAGYTTVFVEITPVPNAEGNYVVRYDGQAMDRFKNGKYSKIVPVLDSDSAHRSKVSVRKP